MLDVRFGWIAPLSGRFHEGAVKSLFGQFRPVGGRVQIAPERTLEHTTPPLRTDVHRLLQLPRCDRVMSAAELQRLPLRSRYSDPAMPACCTTLAQRAISELMKP